MAGRTEVEMVARMLFVVPRQGRNRLRRVAILIR